MDYPNLISTTIPDKCIDEINEAIIFINKKLPDLVTLSQEELTTLPKMGRNTINFVLENLKEAESYPEIVPKNVDIDEIRKDVELIKAIFKILEPLKKLEKRLEDCALLAGSEAYLPSIAIYNAIKADAIRRKYKRDKVNA
ncbi:MAG: hypothetical protein KAQ62_11920 [Cyclobacteriaceae bacterium]|nr:hypothetical protein [Cyclobacteriaceae bacterium]MCK5369257.1 hypothetical protein [Cyclobacteriaceae bacterium]MCK5468264.1 hypothetical protein [Cyclobacteriaceae bacterium]MCK5704304.1 hypothetical protein [Cyclobacteriaceae bacterium]